MLRNSRAELVNTLRRKIFRAALKTRQIGGKLSEADVLIERLEKKKEARRNLVMQASTEQVGYLP